MSVRDGCGAPQKPAAGFCTKCGGDLRTRQASGRSQTDRVFLFVPKVLLAFGSGLVQIFFRWRTPQTVARNALKIRARALPSLRQYDGHR